MLDELNKYLVVRTDRRCESEVVSGSDELGVVPALIETVGPRAVFAWDEFLNARLRSPYTQVRYADAVRRFLSWAERQSLGIQQIAPGHVGRYLRQLPLAVSTKKLHLAALRHFFDAMVERHVVVLNPAATVRSERYAVVEGKTPAIGSRNARRLLDSIDTSTPMGIRDRCIMSILIYTAARVGAVAKLRRCDLLFREGQYQLRFAEKGGKQRLIPVRHDLQVLLLDYLRQTEVESMDRTTPMFGSAIGRSGRLSDRGMTSNDMQRMIKRRVARAGLPADLTAHSFRVTTITDLLRQNVPMEDVQNLAGHADPRTTRLYDRRSREVTRNIVERISI